ncbi:hypothetical protein [Butyrivibrio sp. WCE2006]|uniref:hypothetical protein n=1 Tax=Butyrivibrio sp. WCE2006 TaxID=1410611 RepID=UPI001A9A4BBA
MDTSKKEIQEIFDKYNVVCSKDTSLDKNMCWLIENLKKTIPFERPDAYIVRGNTVFCVEHFRVSQYPHDNRGDIEKMVEGKKRERQIKGTLKEDRKYILDPNITNLVNSIKVGLNVHMKNADIYKERVREIIIDCDVCSYRNVVLLEDTSIQAAYVRKHDTSPRSPLLFDMIGDIILEYKKELWGIIYIGGNEKDKIVSGYLIDELDDLKNMNKRLKILEYKTMHSEETELVSKDNKDDDLQSITIRLY